MTPYKTALEISATFPLERCPENLSWLFEKQVSLLKRYNEQNPDFKFGPVAYHSDLPDQIYLKGMYAAFQEEIMEFYEQYLVTMNCWVNNKRDNILEQMIALNEEIADMIHFMFEMFILSGITEDNINTYYLEMQMENHINFPHGLMGKIMGFARKFNDGEYKLSMPQKCKFEGSESRLVQGCRRLDPTYCEELERKLWQLNYAILQTLRQIPYKPWKVKQRPVNAKMYQKMLMEVFLHFFNLLEFCDITEPIFFHLYQVKNQINNDRINSGY